MLLQQGHKTRRTLLVFRIINILVPTKPDAGRFALQEALSTYQISAGWREGKSRIQKEVRSWNSASDFTWASERASLSALLTSNSSLVSV